jgi:predicted nucleotidyltransferase
MNVLEEIVEPFLAKVDTLLGRDYSAILYGSVARGDFVPELSDENLMLIVDQLDTDILIRLEPPFTEWVGRRLAPPLLMTGAERSRSTDVFPIEITDMLAAYRVLRGTDPLKVMTVKPSDLRRALEREFRGKLTRLRQGFIPSGRRPEDLTTIARQSIASVTVLYRALLVLARRTAQSDAVSTLSAAAALVGFEAVPLTAIASHRGDADWRCRREDFAGYMGAVERTVTYVDELQLGAQE